MSLLRAGAPVLACLLSLAPAWVAASPLRELALQDQHARPLTAATLQGRVVLLSFVFTGCSTTCPLQTRQLAAVHAALPAAARQSIRFLSVSVDPLADTPQNLAAFARRMGADQPGWIFATGRPTELERLYRRLRAFDDGKGAPAPADHRTQLFLYDARGELMQRFAGVPVDESRLLRELSRLALEPPPHSRP